MEKLRKLTDKISSYGQNRLKKKTGEQLQQFLEEEGGKLIHSFLDEDVQLSGSVSELLGKGYTVFVDAPSEERAGFSPSPSFLDVEGLSRSVTEPLENEVEKGYTVFVDAPSEERAGFSPSPSFLDVEGFSRSVTEPLENEVEKGYTLGVEVPSATEETSAVARLRKFHLHSPRRLVVSPLKGYKPKKIIKRRTTKRWSEVEETTLRKAVGLHGTGNWTFILDSYSYLFPERTAGDLKDKWRNICIKDNKATKC